MILLYEWYKDIISEMLILYTIFVFLGWPKVKIWAIQFSEDFDGGHFESAQKGGGGPTYKALTSRLLISGVHWTKWYHSWRILGGGGGCTVTPLDPWTIFLGKVSMYCRYWDFVKIFKCQKDHNQLFFQLDAIF